MQNASSTLPMLIGVMFTVNAGKASAYEDLLAAIFFCNATAETRIMSAEEAYQCVGYQTALKIELLADVTPESYDAMTPSQQAEIGRRGYQAYLEWQAAHPDLVTQLKEKARDVAIRGSR